MQPTNRSPHDINRHQPMKRQAAKTKNVNILWGLSRALQEQDRQLRGDVPQLRHPVLVPICIDDPPPPPPPLLRCRAAAGRDYSTPCRCRRGQEGENQCEPSPGLCLSIRRANTAQLVGLLPVKATIFIRICPSIAHYTFIMGFIDP